MLATGLSSASRHHDRLVPLQQTPYSAQRADLPQLMTQAFIVLQVSGQPSPVSKVWWRSSCSGTEQTSMWTLPTSAGAATVLALATILPICLTARGPRSVRELIERKRWGKTGFAARAITFMPVSEGAQQCCQRRRTVLLDTHIDTDRILICSTDSVLNTNGSHERHALAAW